MPTLEELKRRLKDRFEKREVNLDPQILPAAVDQSIQHHYEHFEQPVIVREVHNIKIKQIIQPIEEDEEVESELHEIVRAAVYREELHDMNSEQKNIRDLNREKMDLARHHVMADTHIETMLEPVVEEKIFSHVLEEIQPVIKKKKKYRHVSREFVPMFEKHMHVCNVENLITAPAIHKDDWRPDAILEKPPRLSRLSLLHDTYVTDSVVADSVDDDHSVQSCTIRQLISSED